MNKQGKDNLFIKAAVMLPVFEQNGELKIVLTKRTDLVQHHKGQICFPGGMCEDSDKHLWHTALRETEEELGLPHHASFLITELPKLCTPTQFEITPFLAFLPNEPCFIPNSSEIAEVIVAPLLHFRDPNHIRFETHTYLGETHNVPFFQFQNHEIWGATGIILLSLLESI